MCGIQFTSLVKSNWLRVSQRQQSHDKLSSHRFESVHGGHHDVASVVSLEIEEVDGADSPQVDAWQPWQDRELKTLWEVGPICVEGLIGYLQEQTRWWTKLEFTGSDPDCLFTKPKQHYLRQLWCAWASQEQHFKITHYLHTAHMSKLHFLHPHKQTPPRHHTTCLSEL